MRFIGMVVLLIGLCWSVCCEAQTRIGFGSTVIYPRSLTGSGPQPAPTLAHTLVVIQPLARQSPLIFVMRLGFTTPMTVFHPAPQVQTGLIYRARPRLLLGGSLTYRYVPQWDTNPSDAHIVSVGFSPVFLHGSGIGFGFPVGVSRNATTDGWSMWAGFDVIVLFGS